ncbi:MAG: hypothetical protein EP312_07410 [Gammaproteobacteria bacterium]|nr:MAG: hypothetical protein EP312_07410 [Gammaproteobacteria bacterium]
MSLMNELLGNASPYIANLVYDIDVRLLFIECVDSPEKQQPVLRIVFPDILSYSEENALDAPDDDNIDDIVDIVRRHDGAYCIDTYKKSIVIKTGSEPFTEKM